MFPCFAVRRKIRNRLSRPHFFADTPPPPSYAISKRSSLFREEIPWPFQQPPFQRKGAKDAKEDKGYGASAF
jgi:hypothetical protein